ncbi:MAG: type IV pilus secretin PilQ [Pseudomonadota bacterium]
MMTIRNVHVHGRMLVFTMLGLLLYGAALSPASAGTVETLAWQPGDKPVIQIKITGDANFKAESLEDGLRQRLRLDGSSMGTALAELSGNEGVKGVYPYPADNGKSVHIDFVLNRQGTLKVEKVEGGLQVTVELAAAGRDAPAAAAGAGASPLSQQREMASTNTIDEVLYAKLPGDRVQLTLRMSGPPPEPSAFTITKPARISLDFPGVRVALPKKHLAIKEGALSSLTAVDGDGRARIVLSLIKPVAYTTAVDGNNFVITLASPATATAGAQDVKTTRFASSRKAGKYALTRIDFRRGPQGDGKIVIGLSDPTVGIDIREQAGEIVVDFLNTSVPGGLQRRLDVVDFATPVQTVDTYPQGAHTRMVITPKGRYEHVAYQTGNVFTISVKPIIERAEEKKVDEFGYSGEKLSLNFQNIDVRAALQVLADFTGLNFVISDTVRGSLTLRLKDVPWDQALDLIVDAKSLAVRKKGNVVVVAPHAEVAAKERAQLQAAKSVVELEPLVTELIQINYAKADEVATLLKSIKPIASASPQQAPGSAVLGGQPAGPDPGAGGTATNSLLSPRGQVTVDARTNSLLIQDTAGKIKEIRKLIAQLDRPVRQVLIEARIVEATDDFTRTVGVRLGVKKARDQAAALAGTDQGTAISGNITDSSSILAAGTVGSNAGGLSVNLGSPGIGTSFSAASLGLTIARLGTDGNLINLELSALEQEGKGKIISSPRVITANQKKAKIEQGQERVFTTITTSTVTVTTKRATLKLEVTPQITPDDRINLEVNVTKDNFTDAVVGILNVKDVNTQVLLDNGETVVIGGIYEHNRQDTITKVPFFGDIPIVGWLFKNKTVQDNKTELLIFLTPRILSEKLSLR